MIIKLSCTPRYRQNSGTSCYLLQGLPGACVNPAPLAAGGVSWEQTSEAR